jgi:hypothetical protein
MKFVSKDNKHSQKQLDRTQAVAAINSQSRKISSHTTQTHGDQHLPLLQTDTMSSSSSQHKNYDPTQSMANPGMNYWVRSNSPTQSTRRNAAGRGLFSGLQDTKHYNVDGGWAGRHVVDEDVHGNNSSLLGWFSGYVPLSSSFL